MTMWTRWETSASNIFFLDLPTQRSFCPTFTSSVLVSDSGLETNSFVSSRYNSQLSVSGTVLANDESQTVPSWSRYNTWCQLSIANTDGGSRRCAAGGVCARLQRRHTLWGWRWAQKTGDETSTTKPVQPMPSHSNLTGSKWPLHWGARACMCKRNGCTLCALTCTLGHALVTTGEAK